MSFIFYILEDLKINSIKDSNNRIRVSIKNLPAAVVLLALVFYLYLNYGDLLFYKMLNVSSLADVGSTYSEGGSSYAAYVGDSSTPLRMILFALPRFVYFLFSPFPWQWRGINDIIAFVFSSLFYLVSFVQGTRSLKYSNAEEKKYAFLFMVIALCTAFVSIPTATLTHLRQMLWQNLHLLTSRNLFSNFRIKFV